MADKSTNSKETENEETVDSTADSDKVDSTGDASQNDADGPVVIEGEAEEIEPGNDSEVAEDDIDQKEDDEEVVAAENAETDEKTVEPLPVIPPAAAEEKRGSALPLILGGLVAGAIGFFAANVGLMGSAPDLSSVEARLDELAGDIAQIEPVDTAPLSARLDALSADLVILQDAPVATGDVPASVIDRIQALENDIATGIEGLSDRIGGLEDRLADLQTDQEAGPSRTEEMTDEELASFQTELQQLTEEARAQVEEAKTRASEIEIAAAEAAAIAERKAAVAALTAAVENGDSFADELAFFESPPEALTAVAGEGVATVGALQRSFPDAARAALAASTVVPQDASAGEKFTAFLKRQTNARSLAPREGDDVDAVLSRAEASLLNGDLAASVAELSALREEAADALGPWLSQAQARIDALDALSTLTDAEN